MRHGLARRCPRRRSGRPDLVLDEEALPFAPASLDLVVATLTLQAVNDLPGSFAQIRRALKPDGLMLAAIVGGDTLTELRESLLAAEVELTGGASPRVAPFADLRALASLLQRAGFALPVADTDRLTVRYPNLFALMADLRALGATSSLTDRLRVPARRALLVRAAEIYAERFSDPDGRIRATVEIVSLSGWAPTKASRSRWHRAPPRPASPTPSARPNGRPGKRPAAGPTLDEIRGKGRRLRAGAGGAMVAAASRRLKPAGPIRDRLDAQFSPSAPEPRPRRPRDARRPRGCARAPLRADRRHRDRPIVRGRRELDPLLGALRLHEGFRTLYPGLLAVLVGLAALVRPSVGLFGATLVLAALCLVLFSAWPGALALTLAILSLARPVRRATA